MFKDIGVLTEEERFTRFGRYFGEFLLYLCVGKMILYVVLFGVFDLIFIVVCVVVYCLFFIIFVDG